MKIYRIVSIGKAMYHYISLSFGSIIQISLFCKSPADPGRVVWSWKAPQNVLQKIFVYCSNCYFQENKLFYA